MNKFKRTSINDVRFLFWYYAALYAVVQKYRKLFRGKKSNDKGRSDDFFLS